jgi:predicted XRE-type DNA-binding protein
MNSLKHLMDTLGVSLEELRSGSRQRRLVDARSLAAALLMQQRFTRQQDVAELFGISQSAVSQLLSRHKDLMEVDAGYRRKWSLVSSQQSS